MMSIDLPFLEKNVLVTGSGRGIGRAIALEFARLGANLVVNYFRNRAPAEQTVAEIRQMGRQAWLEKANMGKVQEIEQLFDRIQKQAGGIDILICNAASGYNRPAMEQKQKGWDWTMNINARSVLFASQLAVPMMDKRGGGSIISISSPGSFRVLPDYIVVGASKAAIESLTRYLAREVGGGRRGGGGGGGGCFAAF